MVREANEKDLKEIVELYLYFHEKSVPEMLLHIMITEERDMLQNV